MRTRAALTLLFLIVAISLTGCTNTPLSTSASMRVEVQVYKGPLSKTISVQWGELKGLVDEATDSLTSFNDGIVTTAATLGYVNGNRCNIIEVSTHLTEPHYNSEKLKEQCAENILHRSRRLEATTTVTVSTYKVDEAGMRDCSRKSKWCCDKLQSEGKKHNQSSLIACHILSAIHDDTQDLINEFNSLQTIIDRRNMMVQTATDKSHSKIEEVQVAEMETKKLCSAASEGHDSTQKVASHEQIVEQVASVAMKLKVKAFYWAETHTGLAPRIREARIAMAAFANLASEYSNQLESRADALQWQHDKNIDAKQLSLSIYLRDTEPTDFLNLYTWNRAAAPALWPDMLWHPLHAFSSAETADRVRVVERLFADHNWSNINTVYGSGQGEFTMALVKDEIGNWNLKSFESDSFELVNAYTKLTLAAVEKTRSSLTNRGSVSTDLLRLTGNLTRGQINGGVDQSNEFTKRLHKRIVKEFETIRASAIKEQNELDGKHEVFNQKAETSYVKARIAKEKAEFLELRDKPSTCVTQGPCNTGDTITKAQDARTEAFKAEIRLQDLFTEEAKKAKSTIADLVKKAVEHARNSETTVATIKDPSDAVAKSARLSAEKAVAYAKAATELSFHAKALANKDHVVAALARHRVEVSARIRDVLNDYAEVIGTLQELRMPPTKNASKQTFP